MNDEKPNFEVAVYGEYITDVKNEVERLLDEKMPDYTRNKMLIIKMIDRR